jgi:hypothetical protein
MKRWTAMLGLGIAVILAALMVLRPFQARGPLSSNATVYVEADGSTDLNGRHFTDLALLQAALMEACGEKSKPMFTVRAKNPIGIDQAKPIFDAARRAGCLRDIGRLQPYTVPGPR